MLTAIGRLSLSAPLSATGIRAVGKANISWSYPLSSQGPIPTFVSPLSYNKNSQSSHGSAIFMHDRP